ncbi:hypothetical protein ACS0TY_016563 [Phlomoides rotata]
MNFESEFSVEDNEEIRDVSNSGEIKVHNNGSCDLQNSDYHELLSDVEEKGTEASESVSSFPWELKSQVRKGYGLKKWRRIKRDASKVGESSVNTDNIVTEELPSFSINPSKRAQVYAEREQKSEASLSSRIPVVRNLEVFPPFGDHSLTMGASVDVGIDLENSEDGSSKSSTAASVPVVKHDMQVAVGFPHDNKYIMSGKKLAQKGPIKKTRGERVKPEKENSDSRSSNYARSNGIGGQRPVFHGGENGDGVQGGRENGGYQDMSTQDVIADLSLEVQKEKIENDGSSLDQDPLVESIYGLQTAQEALEKEVLELKEIGKDISVDGSVSDAQPEITESSEQFPSGDKLNFSSAVHPKMLEIGKRDAEREIEDLCKQRIEAEVEYLTISRTIQKMKVPLVDRITCLEEHKKPVSEKATMLKKKSEKLEKNSCEDIEALKLQKKVCKYTSFFLVQLLSLLAILGVFTFQISPNCGEFVPT